MKVENCDDGVGCSKDSNTRRVVYTTGFLKAPIASVVPVLVQLEYSINRISTRPCFTPVSIIIRYLPTAYALIYRTYKRLPLRHRKFEGFTACVLYAKSQTWKLDLHVCLLAAAAAADNEMMMTSRRGHDNYVQYIVRNTSVQICPCIEPATQKAVALLWQVSPSGRTTRSDKCTGQAPGAISIIIIYRSVVTFVAHPNDLALTLIWPGSL